MTIQLQYSHAKLR